MISEAQILANRSLSAVAVATPAVTHGAMVRQSLAAGKHVQTEARMTLNSDDAREMLEAAQDSPGLIAQIVPAPMTLPVDSTILEMIADGYLGDILSIDMNLSGSGFVDGSGPFHWRHDRDMSGNNIMQMGIWYEGMMRWVGPAEAVSAVGRVHVKHRTDGSGARRQPAPEPCLGPVARGLLRGPRPRGPVHHQHVFEGLRGRR